MIIDFSFQAKTCQLYPCKGACDTEFQYTLTTKRACKFVGGGGSCPFVGEGVCCEGLRLSMPACSHAPNAGREVNSYCAGGRAQLLSALSSNAGSYEQFTGYHTVSAQSIARFTNATALSVQA